MSAAASVVYVIGGEGLAPVKIGVTANLKRRLGSLQTSAPARLSVLWTTPGDVTLERELHARLAAYRTSGRSAHARQTPRPLCCKARRRVVGGRRGLRLSRP
ncbi:GIY-YIG nuclease family protein [Streptomyces sp. NPDC102405]|uniref:GIY-YIG nuclease family protein n=1 Tax=Streptomyces sp. NPDC102405 TaxID=3366170 RepID=UPI0038110105